MAGSNNLSFSMSTASGTTSTDDRPFSLELPVLAEKSVSSGGISSGGSGHREASIDERRAGEASVYSCRSCRGRSIGEESAVARGGPTWISSACGAALTAQDHIDKHGQAAPPLVKYQSTHPSMDRKVVRAPKGTYMLHPHSPTRIYWDAFSTAALLFNAVRCCTPWTHTVGCP